MPPDEIKKLNDTIAFSNSIAQQFLVFKETANQEIMQLEAQHNELKDDISKLAAENKDLINLINANRSWIAVCDTAIKELRVQINLIVKGPSKTEGPLSVKPVNEYKHLNWRKFWK